MYLTKTNIICQYTYLHSFKINEWQVQIFWYHFLLTNDLYLYIYLQS